MSAVSAEAREGSTPRNTRFGGGVRGGEVAVRREERTSRVLGPLPPRRLVREVARSLESSVGKEGTLWVEVVSCFVRMCVMGSYVRIVSM